MVPVKACAETDLLRPTDSVTTVTECLVPGRRALNSTHVVVSVRLMFLNRTPSGSLSRTLMDSVRPTPTSHDTVRLCGDEDATWRPCTEEGATGAEIKTFYFCVIYGGLCCSDKERVKV